MDGLQALTFFNLTYMLFASSEVMVASWHVDLVTRLAGMLAILATAPACWKISEAVEQHDG